jgi:protocatechuate 3,4-dioxygenase beta subunit
MKPGDNIEESIRKLRHTTSAEMDERILNDAQAALRESIKSRRPTAVKSTIATLAMVAVLIIAVFIGVKVFTAPAPKQPQSLTQKQAPAPEAAIETAKESEQDLGVEPGAEPAEEKFEAELKEIKKLFAAGDIDGLASMLFGKPLASWLAAAVYLAEIGDSQALEALEKLSSAVGGDEPNNLFSVAAAEVRDRIEQEQQEVELVEGLEGEQRDSNKAEASSVPSIVSYGIEASDDFVGELVKGQGSPHEFNGVVVDENDNPIEDVLVDAWTWYPGNETYTDANGYFYLGGFKDQKTIEVRFSKENYSPRLIVRQPLGVRDAVVVLGDKTYFEGQVRTADGQPVPGAIIRADQGAKDAEGVTLGSVWTETHSDEQGNYRLYVQDDKYDIQVEADSIGVARMQDVIIGEGEAKQLDIVLESGVTFLAEVMDSQTGEPVEGLRLFHWQHPGVEGISDANGLVEIAGMPPGRFEFQVEADGYTRWWSDQCLSEWSRFKMDPNEGSWQRNFDSLDFDLKVGMEPVTIIVEQGVRIRGEVLDPKGNPVSGATVAPALTGTGNSITGDTRFSVLTEEDGSFEMLLPASKERRYNLVAHDGKFQQWRNWANGVTEPVVTSPGEDLNGVVLWLSEPATVRGKVTDRSGRPVAERKVRAHAFDKLGNRYYDPTTETDRDGNFELKFIRPGKHYIQVYPFWFDTEEAPQGTSQIVTVQAGQTIDGIELVVEDDRNF